MAARSFRDDEHFQMGRRGEQVVVAMLQSLGWGIIPSYDYAGPNGDRAPSLQAHGRWLPLPDLDTARGGHRRWVEVKTKRSANYTRKDAEYVHGIDLDKFQQYLDVQDITGAEIWLAFYELDTQMVFHQSLDRLALVMRRGDEARKMSRSGMAFFPRADLLLLGAVIDDGGRLRFELASEPRS